MACWIHSAAFQTDRWTIRLKVPTCLTIFFQNPLSIWTCSQSINIKVQKGGWMEGMTFDDFIFHTSHLVSVSVHLILMTLSDLLHHKKRNMKFWNTNIYFSFCCWGTLLLCNINRVIYIYIIILQRLRAAHSIKLIKPVMFHQLLCSAAAEMQFRFKQGSGMFLKYAAPL